MGFLCPGVFEIAARRGLRGDHRGGEGAERQGEAARGTAHPQVLPELPRTRHARHVGNVRPRRDGGARGMRSHLVTLRHVCKGPTPCNKSSMDKELICVIAS